METRYLHNFPYKFHLSIYIMNNKSVGSPDAVILETFRVDKNQLLHVNPTRKYVHIIIKGTDIP